MERQLLFLHSHDDAYSFLGTKSKIVCLLSLKAWKIAGAEVTFIAS